MVCQKIKRPKYKICIGDLDEEIIIKSKTLTPSNISEYDAEIATDLLDVVWASHDAVKGYRSFDFSEANGQAKITDKFIIRYRDDIDLTTIIEKESILYQVVEVLPMRKEFLTIYANRKGSSDVVINLI